MTEANPSSDNRAVSPVLGVIMMVALTILLASVMGVFVLGVGETAQERPPTVNFELSWNDDSLVVAHTSGERIPSDRLAIVGPDDVTASFDDEEAWNEGWNSPVTAGQEREVILGEEAPPGTYRLVWQTADSSAVLQTIEKSA